MSLVSRKDSSTSLAPSLSQEPGSDAARSGPGVASSVKQSVTRHLGPLADLVHPRPAQEVKDHKLRNALRQPRTPLLEVSQMVCVDGANVQGISRRHQNTGWFALFSAGHQDLEKFSELVGVLRVGGQRVDFDAENSHKERLIHAAVKSQSLPAALMAAVYSDPRIENKWGDSALSMAKGILDDAKLKGTGPKAAEAVRVAQEIYDVMRGAADVLGHRDVIAGEKRRMEESQLRISNSSEEIQRLVKKLGFTPVGVELPPGAETSSPALEGSSSTPQPTQSGLAPVLEEHEAESSQMGERRGLGGQNR